MSDNGPQFTSTEFLEFSKARDFEHRTSSPEHHQSNGMAESAVKSAKRLLRKTKAAGTDFQLALLDFRNTPSQGMGLSPVQLFMNRRSRTLLPTSTTLLQPCSVTLETQQSKLREKQKNQTRYYNRQAKDLDALKKGDVVRMKPTRAGQHQWKKATVTSSYGNRSYLVETEDGGKYRRNRVHLRKSEETAYTDDDIDPTSPPNDEQPESEPPTSEVPEQTLDVSQSSSLPSDATIQSPILRRPQRQRLQISVVMCI